MYFGILVFGLLLLWMLLYINWYFIISFSIKLKTDVLIYHDKISLIGSFLLASVSTYVISFHILFFDAFMTTYMSLTGLAVFLIAFRIFSKGLFGSALRAKIIAVTLKSFSVIAVLASVLILLIRSAFFI